VKVRRAVAETRQRLEAAGCESPEVESEILVAHLLGAARSEIALDDSRKLSKAEERTLDLLVARREEREPLAYVLGEWGFRRLLLAVDARVLVPRPETEIVVERCLARIGTLTEPRVLDVGTGSGAIALAIADEHPGARVTGVDASSGALEVAGANVVRTGIAIDLRTWDLFTGLPEGPWDLVVSNPPYVLPEEIETLEPEVRDWEPRLALVDDGQTARLSREARDVLDGVLVVEVHEALADQAKGLLDELGYLDTEIRPDLTGRPRIVEGRWHPA